MLEYNEMMSILPVTPKPGEGGFFSQQPVAPTCHVEALAKMEARQKADQLPARERFRSQPSTVCGVAPKNIRPNEVTHIRFFKIRDTVCKLHIVFCILMSNKQFWTKTNAAVLKAVRSANGKSDSVLRRDWKLKQASRSGSHSYVSISDVRTLGTGLSRTP